MIHMHKACFHRTHCLKVYFAWIKRVQLRVQSHFVLVLVMLVKSLFTQLPREG